MNRGPYRALWLSRRAQRAAASLLFEALESPTLTPAERREIETEWRLALDLARSTGRILARADVRCPDEVSS